MKGFWGPSLLGGSFIDSRTLSGGLFSVRIFFGRLSHNWIILTRALIRPITIRSSQEVVKKIVKKPAKAGKKAPRAAARKRAGR